MSRPLLPVVLLVAGCSAAPPGEDVTRTASAIIGGTTSDASQNAVVLLHYPINGYEAFECTATLLAPSLVLTARHCVTSIVSDAGFTCDQNGNGSSGGNLAGDFTPSNIFVITGTKRPFDPTSSFAARGKKIIHDGATNLCNHDLALVLLDRAIAGADIAPIRLDTPVTKSETFTAIGWGVTSATPQPSTRQQRTNVAVQAVGPMLDTSTLIAIPDHEFMVGESICQGDSGGPAIDSKSGAVLGVVSRGGNGTAQNPSDPSASCVGGYNFYSAASGYKDMILDAYSQAGQDPWLEGDRDPRLAKFGEACANNDACRSSLCLGDKDGNGTVCTQSCDTDNPCPNGYVCSSSGELKICKPKPPPAPNTGGAKGCSAGGTAPDASVALLGAALLMARRRRRA
jgi:MYXO-CTERM domain-containing protein